MVSLYLVPGQPSGEGIRVTPPLCVEELTYERSTSDGAALLTWQPTEESVDRSFVGLLHGLLKDNSEGRISPITYDVRQLILAFIDFALNDFQGFAYQKVNRARSADQMKVDDLLASQRTDLYVGIQYGLAGILDRAWRNPAFREELVSVSDTERGWQYVSLPIFQKLTRWALNPTSENASSLGEVPWQGMPFWVRKLYVVSKAAGDGIWIGIRGGAKALEKMSNDEILARKTWQVGPRPISSAWFSGADFCRILESKGVTFENPRDPD